MASRCLGAAWILLVLLIVGCATTTRCHWKDAKTAGTAEAYQAFLDQNPNGTLADSARLKVEDLAWQDACRIHTAESYRAFQQQYPRGRHAAQARDSMEAIAWYKARRGGPAGARAAFLRSFSDGQYADVDTDDTRRTGAVGALDRFLQMHYPDDSGLRVEHQEAQYHPVDRDDADARRRTDSLRVLWSRQMPGSWRCLSGKFSGGSVNLKIGVEGGDYAGAVVSVAYSPEYHRYGGYLVGVTEDMASNGWLEGDLFWAIDEVPATSGTTGSGHRSTHCGRCVVRIGTRYASDVPLFTPPQRFATFMNFAIEIRNDSTFLEVERIPDGTVCNTSETWVKIGP